MTTREQDLERAIAMYKVIISDTSSPLYQDMFLTHRLREMEIELSEIRRIK